MDTDPVWKGVDGLYPSVPVVSLARIYHVFEVFHQLWVYWLGYRRLALFEGLNRWASHTESIWGAWVLIRNSSSGQECCLHLWIKERGWVLKAITASCITFRSSIWRHPLIIQAPWVHRASSHATTILRHCHITEWFIILLLNNFPCLINLLISKVAPEKQLVKLSSVLKRILQRQYG